MLASIFIIDLLSWNSAKFHTNIMPDTDEENNSIVPDIVQNEQDRLVYPHLYDDIFCDRSTGSTENERNDCF